MFSILAIVEDAHTKKVFTDVFSKVCYSHQVIFKTNNYANCIKDGTFDLLFLDLDIFTMWEIEEVKKKKYNTNIAFILSSSNVEKLTEYEDNFHEKVLYAFKPVQPGCLSRKLRTLDPSRINIAESNGVDLDFFLGKHPSAVAFTEKIGLLEKTRHPVESILILGETGAGKEIYARFIHQKLRPNKSFIAVNCNSISANLLEEELFGHEKGVFTNAHAARRGILEEYSDGTVFFDEFAEMDMYLQSKFLRILEDRLIRRIGSNKTVRCNSLFVFATNRNLEEEIRMKRFRLDLFHRINRITFHLPPLRERKEDIGSLARYLLTKANEKYNRQLELDEHVIEFFKSCAWKGNVREMKNLLESLVCFAEGEAATIRLDDLPTSFFRQQSEKENGERPDREPAPMDIEGRTLEEMTESFQKMIIEKAMREAENQKGLAAKMLGLSRFQLYRYLKYFNLESTN